MPCAVFHSSTSFRTIDLLPQPNWWLNSQKLLWHGVPLNTSLVVGNFTQLKTGRPQYLGNVVLVNVLLAPKVMISTSSMPFTVFTVSLAVHWRLCLVSRKENVDLEWQAATRLNNPAVRLTFKEYVQPWQILPQIFHPKFSYIDSLSIALAGIQTLFLHWTWSCFFPLSRGRVCILPAGPDPGLGTCGCAKVLVDVYYSDFAFVLLFYLHNFFWPDYQRSDADSDLLKFTAPLRFRFHLILGQGLGKAYDHGLSFEIMLTGTMYITTLVWATTDRILAFFLSFGTRCHVL